MRRQAFANASLLVSRLAICVLLGFVTTVLVAWALAAWLPHRDLTRQFNLSFKHGDPAASAITVYDYWRPGMVRRFWRVEPRTGGGGFPIICHELDPGVARIEQGALRERSWGGLAEALETRPSKPVTVIEHASGWPIVALWCSVTGPGVERPGGVLDTRNGWLVSQSTGPGKFRVLPLMPIASGLAVDTAVFGGGWTVLLVVASLIRRIMRRLCGRCSACGYDLRGSGGSCPECGSTRRDRPAAAIPSPHDVARG